MADSPTLPISHWIGLVPCQGAQRQAPRGAALAVVDRAGRLSTLATVVPPYADSRANGLELLRLILGGDGSGLGGGDWQPLVILDRFTPKGRGPRPETEPVRVYTAGLLRGYLDAAGVPYVEIPRRLWVDAAIAGERKPERGESREGARLRAAADRWSRFRPARQADLHHAEAALLAEVGRARFRTLEAVA